MTGYVGAIEQATEQNTAFRRVLFTSQHQQLVLMCLQPSEDIGDEVHEDTDQFFRVEQGEATVIFNETEKHQVTAGDGIIVPAGTYHNVINTSSDKPLKLYTIYSPPHHPDGTVHHTKSDAQAAEKAE